MCYGLWKIWWQVASMRLTGSIRTSELVCLSFPHTRTHTYAPIRTHPHIHANAHTRTYTHVHTCADGQSIVSTNMFEKSTNQYVNPIIRRTSWDSKNNFVGHKLTVCAAKYNPCYFYPRKVRTDHRGGAQAWACNCLCVFILAAGVCVRICGRVFWVQECACM